jgi:hypothetical protein
MRINRSLLNWGVFLIALGGVPLAVQQGWAEADIAGDLWRVWPLILVGIGLGLILRWTPAAWLGGAIVAGAFGLIFGALIAGGIQGVSSACIGLGSGESRTTSESGPATGTAFSLTVELSCGDLEVTRNAGAEWSVVAEHGEDDVPAIAGDETSLDIEQDGEPQDLFAFTQQTRADWTIGVPADAALSAGVTLNAASGTIDLGAAPLASLGATFNASDVGIDIGAAMTPQPASIGITFNASSGRLALPSGSLTGSIALNASSLTLCLPQDAEARFELESTLSSADFATAGLSNVGNGWQTDGFTTAASRIDLSVSSTVSTITLERSEVCQ